VLSEDRCPRRRRHVGRSGTLDSALVNPVAPARRISAPPVQHDGRAEQHGREQYQRSGFAPALDWLGHCDRLDGEGAVREIRLREGVAVGTLAPWDGEPRQGDDTRSDDSQEERSHIRLDTSFPSNLAATLDARKRKEGDGVVSPGVTLVAVPRVFRLREETVDRRGGPRESAAARV